MSSQLFLTTHHHWGRLLVDWVWVRFSFLFLILGAARCLIGWAVTWRTSSGDRTWAANSVLLTLKSLCRYLQKDEKMEKLKLVLTSVYFVVTYNPRACSFPQSSCTRWSRHRSHSQTDSWRTAFYRRWHCVGILAGWFPLRRRPSAPHDHWLRTLSHPWCGSPRPRSLPPGCETVGRPRSDPLACYPWSAAGAS